MTAATLHEAMSSGEFVERCQYMALRDRHFRDICRDWTSRPHTFDQIRDEIDARILTQKHQRECETAFAQRRIGL